MSYLKLPKHYHPSFKNPQSPPLGRVGIEWSDPLAHALSLGIVFNQANGDPLDLVGGGSGTRTTGADWGVTEAKTAMVFDGDSRVTFDGTNANEITGDYTIVVGLLGTAMDSSGGLWAKNDSTSGNASQLQRFGGADDLYIQHGSSFVTFDGNFTEPNILDGSYHVIACSYDGSDLRAYLDGALESTKALATAVPANKDGEWKIASARDATILGVTASYFFFYVYNRKLSDAEIAEISRNPYRIVRPTQPLIYLVPDGDASETVNFSTETLNINEQSFDINETVDFSTENLNLTGHSFSIDTTVTCNTETLNITEQSFNIDVSVDFSEEQLDLGAQVFSIIEGDETVSMSTADITLSGKGFDIDEVVDFNEETLNATEQAFTIEEGEAIFCNTEAITVTGNSFSIDESVAMNEETLNVTGHAFSLGDVISFSEETLNLTEQTFTIEEGEAVFMNNETINVAGNAFTLQSDSVCFMNTEQLIVSGRAQELNGWWEFFLALPNLNSRQLNDRVVEYCSLQGADGISFNDLFYNYLGDKGYEGTFSDRLDQWQEDGFPP